MNQNTETQPETENLLDDAQALLTATSNASGEKVQAARERLAAAIDKAKQAELVPGIRTTGGVRLFGV